MKEISEEIEQQFYDVLKHKVSILDFERWVYETKELETELPEELYMEMISLNYKQKFAQHELDKLVSPYVNKGKFEIKKIGAFMKSIIDRDADCAASIEMTYDLYCAGHIFLRNMGLTYGILIGWPPVGEYKKTWDEITEAQQQELLDQFYPAIVEDAREVLGWIENGKIKISEDLDEFGKFVVLDLREG